MGKSGKGVNDTVIDVYVKEFVGIINHLKKQGYKPYKGYFIIEKDTLKELLNHNKYEMPEAKLKTWKALHWIDTDQNRLTKRVAQKVVIKMDNSVYSELNRLIST